VGVTPIQVMSVGSSTTIMTPADEFAACFERMYEICHTQGWGDPFSYARSREIHLANRLGHTVAPTFDGADGIDEDGGCEYKTTIGKTIQGTYHGISKQKTWEEQLKYLRENKICKYKNHYFARYEGAIIVEVYRLDCEKVLEELLPKLKLQFDSTKVRKDPRLGASICASYIKKHGTLIAPK
jgi:hypothetical protein